MQRKLYRSRTDPKHRSSSRVWYKKRAAKPAAPLARTTRRRGSFVNISQEMKHGRGPRR